jgi:predicted 2-oxoglutarate/Fe(II)-dependent dioxygenase YbiX
MPAADFFRSLGLFVARDFFDAAWCERLRLEAVSASKSHATVVRKSIERLDEGMRKTKWAGVSASTIAAVKARLLAVKPRLESHFNVTLTGCEEPQCLAYKAGDFFRLHQDTADDPDALTYVRARQVSTVIFLNSAAEARGPESYGGGALTFYGLIDDPCWKTYGFPVVGEQGLLIAFRSNILHEVTVVTQGERYSIVSWFF